MPFFCSNFLICSSIFCPMRSRLLLEQPDLLADLAFDDVFAEFENSNLPLDLFFKLLKGGMRRHYLNIALRDQFVAILKHFDDEGQHVDA